MTWVWHWIPDPCGSYDYELSGEFDSGVMYTEQAVPVTGLRPVFKFKCGMKKVKRFHCAPATDCVVDSVWREIILKFVPADRVQFYPAQLIGRGGETCHDYFWVIPFDRVFCIDLEKSDIRRSIVKDSLTMIIRADQYAHVPGCMKGKHLARDARQFSHLVISDELHDALAATGESSMFYRPGDVPTLFGPNGPFKQKFQARNVH